MFFIRRREIRPAIVLNGSIPKEAAHVSFGITRPKEPQPLLSRSRYFLGAKIREYWEKYNLNTTAE